MTTMEVDPIRQAQREAFALFCKQLSFAHLNLNGRLPSKCEEWVKRNGDFLESTKEAFEKGCGAIICYSSAIEKPHLPSQEEIKNYHNFLFKKEPFSVFCNLLSATFRQEPALKSNEVKEAIEKCQTYLKGSILLDTIPGFKKVYGEGCHTIGQYYSIIVEAMLLPSCRDSDLSDEEKDSEEANYCLSKRKEIQNLGEKIKENFRVLFEAHQLQDLNDPDCKQINETFKILFDAIQNQVLRYLTNRWQ